MRRRVVDLEHRERAALSDAYWGYIHARCVSRVSELYKRRCEILHEVQDKVGVEIVPSYVLIPKG